MCLPPPFFSNDVGQVIYQATANDVWHVASSTDNSFVNLSYNNRPSSIHTSHKRLGISPNKIGFTGSKGKHMIPLNGRPLGSVLWHGSIFPQKSYKVGDLSQNEFCQSFEKGDFQTVREWVSEWVSERDRLGCVCVWEREEVGVGVFSPNE